MDNTYVISDSHFCHEKIIQYCNRPKNHNALMIKNWNNIVDEGDTVLHLGDFSAGVNSFKGGFETLKKIANGLNGDIHLLRGNHDNYSNEIYIKELGFKSVNEFMVIENVFFCHFPLLIDEYTKKPQRIQRLINEYKKSNCNFLIHGHTHNNPVSWKRKNWMNISVEKTKYSPIDIEKLFKVINK